MKFIYSMIFIVVATGSYAKSSVSFDQLGNMTAPDIKLLKLGKKANKKGDFAHANEQFKKAALFGNEHAKILLANNFINAKNYSTALAWLGLINIKNIKNHNNISQAIKTLKQNLTNEQKTASQILFDQLQLKYNSQVTQQYRQDWRKQLQFTGSRIRGQIPSQLTVLPVENGMLGINTITITGHEIRSQLDQYVNEYDLQIHKGQVTLAPIKLSNN